MIYLFWGEDRAAKEQKIAEVKSKYLTSEDAFKFDLEILHGSKCGPDILKKSLIALPAISKRRLVLLRVAEKLNTQNKKIILEFMQTENQHCVLILDSNEELPKNSFFNKVTASAKVMRFGGGVARENVFDMTRAMGNRNSSGALKILDNWMKDGNHPLQIMGGLVWF